MFIYLMNIHTVYSSFLSVLGAGSTFTAMVWRDQVTKPEVSKRTFDSIND